MQNWRRSKGLYNCVWSCLRMTRCCLALYWLSVCSSESTSASYYKYIKLRAISTAGKSLLLIPTPQNTTFTDPSCPFKMIKQTEKRFVVIGFYLSQTFYFFITQCVWVLYCLLCKLTLCKIKVVPSFQTILAVWSSHSSHWSLTRHPLLQEELASKVSCRSSSSTPAYGNKQEPQAFPAGCRPGWHHFTLLLPVAHTLVHSQTCSIK